MYVDLHLDLAYPTSSTIMEKNQNIHALHTLQIGYFDI